MATRRLILAAGVLSALGIGVAFPQSRMPRVGILSAAPIEKSPLAKELLAALGDLGYPQGAGMTVESRYSPDQSRYPTLARELIALKCDVIFAFVDEASARAFADARTNIPIILLAFDYDPVEKGIVRSYSRPGGNMTGVYTPIALLTMKRLEIAQEVLPKAKRFLVLSDRFTADHLAALRKSAAERQVQLTVVEFAKSPYDFQAAFEAGRRDSVDAVWLFTTPEFLQRRAEISALLLSHKRPGLTGQVMSELPGVLVAYGIDLTKGVRRGAEMAARILKGAKPGEMPVEQTDSFELLVNLKTAKTLSVRVPQSVLTRATRVIE